MHGEGVLQKTIGAETVRDFLVELPEAQRVHFLEKIDPARVVALIEFAQWVKALGPVRSVAIISGSKDEPELLFLPAVTVHYFNFAESRLWDLNADWEDGRLGAHRESFDLVLCEQVLEHVENPIQAVKNAMLLVAPGGHLHISAPGVNGTHGEPHYFYTGFHPHALESFCAQAGFSDIRAGGWGSKKSVQMYATCDWSPLAVSAFVDLIRKIPNLKSNLRQGIRHWLTYGRRRFFATKPYRHFTISWVTARRD